ncbi:MAG: ATP-binding cassette domain-containing protein [Anaerolineae bacterium]|jgi:ABC-2 type transport system ATP-binding protein|nr:ATP-binding cassette domain-containing protein [Anaerolineae bacterium]
MQQTAISVEHISKVYGTFKAVDDLSFEVNRGEIFAMLGPNGAGKSTTIRMILDILRPDTGKIAIFGEKISEDLKHRIGYLPEERGLYREVPVIEVMTYLGTLKGLTRPEAKKRAMRLLEQLELADKAKKKVKEFSKGMQQKVQFAVTIIHEPDLIIVDEPFSGLDPVNTQLMKNMVKDLRQKGTAVVMSSHEMFQVEEMADRLLMVNRGKLALYGAVDEVRKRYAIHGIIIEGQGDWEKLHGVESVEHASNSRNAMLIRLQPNVTTDAILSEIARNDAYHITKFEQAVPSLNDIFITVAGERIEDIEAEYKEKHTTSTNPTVKRGFLGRKAK